VCPECLLERRLGARALSRSVFVWERGGDQYRLVVAFMERLHHLVVSNLPSRRRCRPDLRMVRPRGKWKPRRTAW